VAAPAHRTRHPPLPGVRRRRRPRHPGRSLHGRGRHGMAAAVRRARHLRPRLSRRRPAGRRCAPAGRDRRLRADPGRGRHRAVGERHHPHDRGRQPRDGHLPPARPVRHLPRRRDPGRADDGAGRARHLALAGGDRDDPGRRGAGRVLHAHRLGDGGAGRDRARPRPLPLAAPDRAADGRGRPAAARGAVARAVGQPDPGGPVRHRQLLPVTSVAVAAEPAEGPAETADRPRARRHRRAERHAVARALRLRACGRRDRPVRVPGIRLAAPGRPPRLPRGAAVGGPQPIGPSAGGGARGHRRLRRLPARERRLEPDDAERGQRHGVGGVRLRARGRAARSPAGCACSARPASAPPPTRCSARPDRRRRRPSRCRDAARAAAARSRSQPVPPMPRPSGAAACAGRRA
jgi:hypothetical protein